MSVLQITQIQQVTLDQWWKVVNNVFDWFFFVLWCKVDDVMLRLLIVFFLGMFCKLVFCKLENIRWPNNVTWNIQQRCLVKMAKATSHLWQPLTQMLQKGHSFYKKYKLTKMASNINGTSQKWHLITYVVVKNPVLGLNKPRIHCNIEIQYFQYILSINVYRKENHRDHIVH